MKKNVLLMAVIAAISFMSIQRANAQWWSLTGNAGTTPGTNFLGTTDNKFVVFKTNNVERGRILSTGGWKFNGTVNGVNGYAINGTPFLNQYGSIYNTFAGNAGNLTLTGSGITGVGYFSLNVNTSGFQNTALGGYTLAFNTSGFENTATGYTALYKNITGFQNTATGASALYNATGSYNTAHGAYSLFSNKTGNNNVAVGDFILYNNTTGYSNVAVGTRALYASTNAHNVVAVGDSALYNQAATYEEGEFPSPANNTAVGSKALYATTTGTNNSATGFQSLYLNSTGSRNTAHGSRALYSNTAGSCNTAVGNDALYVTTGSNNTGIGCGASVNAGLSNATALGGNALATASNQVMLGNTSVTSVKAAGNFVIYSDGRFKKDIKENVPGLSFINLLKPVTYNYDIHKLNDHITGKEGITASDKNSGCCKTEAEQAIVNKERIRYTGFVAQDVEASAKALDYDFSGVYKPQNDKDAYGLSYADFVVPLVKAVQELSKENEDLKKQVNEIKALVLQMQQGASHPSDQGAKAANSSAILSNNTSLQQNIPNPFTTATIIGYTLPQQFKSAYISLTDNNGKVMKQVTVSGSGKGQLAIDASALSAGTYHYTLFVDGKRMDTKQMVVAK